MKTALVLSALLLSLPAHAVVLFNNSSIKREVSLWFDGSADTSSSKTAPSCSITLEADSAENIELPESCTMIGIQVRWVMDDEEVVVITELQPASYEKTEFIDNDSLIFIHQPTAQDPLVIKLLGPILARVMQQKVLEMAVALLNEDEEEEVVVIEEHEAN